MRTMSTTLVPTTIFGRLAGTHIPLHRGSWLANPMNSLYTLGVRQTNSLTADLERLKNGDHSASLLGQFPICAAMSPTDGHSR